MKSAIEKYRKQAAYSKGIRKVSALASLAQALAVVDLREAEETGLKAVSLARKLLGRLEPDDRRSAQYQIILARALFAHAGCLRASLRYAEIKAPLLEALQLWERHEAWDEMIPALILQVEILREQQDTAGALERNQFALAICDQLALRKYYSDLYANEAATRVKRDESELADTAVERALANLRYSPEEQRPSILAQISNVLNSIGKTEEALQSVGQAIEVARRMDNKYLLLRLLFNYSAYTYMLDPRRDYASPLTEAIELARVIGNRAHEAFSHEMYGVRTMRSGEYDRAIRELSQAHDIYREIGSRPDKMRIPAWLGLVYMELGAEELGKAYLKEAVDLLTDKPIRDGSTAVYRIVLDYAPEHLDVEQVIQHLTTSIADTEANNFDALATQEMVLGSALEVRGLFEDARHQYRSALHKLRNFHHPCLKANATLALGRIESRMGKPAEGRSLLLEALRLSESCHEWQTTGRIYSELAAVAEQLGDFKAALRYRTILHAKERAIVLRQANTSVEQLMASESAGQMQLRYEEKLARHAALRQEAETVRKEAAIDALRDEEDAKLLRRIVNQLEEFVLQPGELDPGPVRAIAGDIDQFIAQDVPAAAEDANSEQADALEALRQRFPELTATECRVCLAIQEGRSNRSIAEVLNVSMRAVETYRYRIRKKFALAKGQNLSEFLMLKT